MAAAVAGSGTGETTAVVSRRMAATRAEAAGGAVGADVPSRAAVCRASQTRAAATNAPMAASRSVKSVTAMFARGSIAPGARVQKMAPELRRAPSLRILAAHAR